VHHGGTKAITGPLAPPWNTQLFRRLGALLLRKIGHCIQLWTENSLLFKAFWHIWPHHFWNLRLYDDSTLFVKNAAKKKKKHHCRQGQCGGNSAMSSFKGLKAPRKWPKEKLRISDARYLTAKRWLKQWAKALTRKEKSIENE